MEQWPHLNELVQCYRTDWVKDESKYGHYESIGPLSFQNQIFEGPDTDIETGRIGLMQMLIGLFPFGAKMLIALPKDNNILRKGKTSLQNQLPLDMNIQFKMLS